MTLSFQESLEACLHRIPEGRTATCGAVARALGDVRASRAVAQFLGDHPDLGAGYRVVRADGRPVLQSRLPALASECELDERGRVPTDAILDRLPRVPLLDVLRKEQRRLARQVVERDDFDKVSRVGGADVSYNGDRAFAVAVTMDAESLDPLEIVVRTTRVDFPYIPTYLAFRELPAIRLAVEGLKEKPDVLFADGHGRLHPIHFGFACFAGVSLDLPTVGIAKHALVGRAQPGARRDADTTPIRLDGRVGGYAWRPPGASRPMYVSVGHRISLETALALTQQVTRQRYPEPLRLADRISKEEKKKNGERSASERAAQPRPPAQGIRAA